ncbi:MAG: hypothetical protein HDT27_07060 [Subdoligranulum sp.]|nr:hypothetical protein [Subdoligranulum sp.]
MNPWFSQFVEISAEIFRVAPFLTGGFSEKGAIFVWFFRQTFAHDSIGFAHIKSSALFHPKSSALFQSAQIQKGRYLI